MLESCQPVAIGFEPPVVDHHRIDRLGHRQRGVERPAGAEAPADRTDARRTQPSPQKIVRRGEVGLEQRGVRDGLDHQVVRDVGIVGASTAVEIDGQRRVPLAGQPPRHRANAVVEAPPFMDDDQPGKRPVALAGAGQVPGQCRLAQRAVLDRLAADRARRLIVVALFGAYPFRQLVVVGRCARASDETQRKKEHRTTHRVLQHGVRSNIPTFANECWNVRPDPTRLLANVGMLDLTPDKRQRRAVRATLAPGDSTRMLGPRHGTARLHLRTYGRTPSAPVSVATAIVTGCSVVGSASTTASVSITGSTGCRRARFDAAFVWSGSSSTALL